MKTWYEFREGDTFTVARRRAPRWDLAVATSLPRVGSRRRLAHQIRQDMWRRLKRLRGFSPVVRVTHRDEVCDVLAGGEVAGRFPSAHAEAALAELLDNPRLRSRWIACAGGRSDA